MTTLNAAVADQLTAFKKDVDKEIAKGKDVNIAIMDTLKPIIKSIIGVICFDGNGYSDEWQKEAKKRGLDVETCVPQMFKAFTEKENIEMFTRMGIYSEKELEARNEVRWEMYTKKVQIEARVMGRMAINHIIPAALSYQTKLLDNIQKIKDIFPDNYREMATVEIDLVQKIAAKITEIRDKVNSMVEARKNANKITDEYQKALAYYNIAESLFAIRRPIDKLEEIVDNDMWPLPKYRELLFIN